MKKIDEIVRNLKISPALLAECYDIPLGNYYNYLSDLYIDLFTFTANNKNFTWNGLLYFANNMIDIIEQAKEANIVIGECYLFDDIVTKLLSYDEQIKSTELPKNISWQRKERIKTFNLLREEYESVRIVKKIEKKQPDNINDFIVSQELVTLNSFKNRTKSSGNDVAYYQNEYELFSDLRNTIMKKSVSLDQKEYMLYISKELLPKVDALLLESVITRDEAHDLMLALRLCIDNIKSNVNIRNKNDEIIRNIKIEEKVRKYR